MDKYNEGFWSLGFQDQVESLQKAIRPRFYLGSNELCQGRVLWQCLLDPAGYGRIAESKYQGRGFLVLEELSRHQFSERCPAIVRTPFVQDCPEMATEEVAGFFRNRASGLGECPELANSGWAPAAWSSFAAVPIGGDLGDVVGEASDEVWPDNSYRFFDLNEVEEGGVVYRASCTPTVHAFLRTGSAWRYIKADWRWPYDWGIRIGTMIRTLDPAF